MPECEDAPNPKRFADWFPEAMYDFDQFAAAIAWLQSICAHQRDLLGVAQACMAKERLGLSCTRYTGPHDGADLVALLDEAGPTRLPDTSMLRSLLILSLEHLVLQHPALRGLFLLSPAENSGECARLILPDGRLVRMHLDRDTSAGEVAQKLQAEGGRIQQQESEVCFFVFAQLKSALPLRPSPNVLATGMRLPHIANGLVRLVWAMPISP